MMKFYPAEIFRWSDLGIVADDATKEGGSAISFGPSDKHLNKVAVNARELRAAIQCFKYVVLKCKDFNGKKKEKIMLTPDAVKLIEPGRKHDGPDGEYFVVDWDTVELGYHETLPF